MSTMVLLQLYVDSIIINIGFIMFIRTKSNLK